MADTRPSPPPATRRGDAADVYHGVTVPDPYRWLEDGESAETATWVAAHNERTREALDARPSRPHWHERLAALTALPTVAGAVVRGDRLFVMERAASADQFALVLRSTVDAAAPPRMLLDPARLAADAAVAIDWFHPSPDGTLVAYGLSEGGTEDSTLYVLDVATGERLRDTIADTRAASVAWDATGTGFWYTRYPADDQYHRHVRHHRLGATAADDAVVFDDLPTPQAWPDVSASPDGRYLLVEMLVGWGRIDAHLLDTATGEWRTVVAGVEAQSSFVFHRDELIGVTTREAPNGRVVAAPLANPSDWRTLVAERDVVLGRLEVCADELLLVTSRDAVDTIERWRLGAEPHASAVGPDPIGDLGLVAVQALGAHGDCAAVVVASYQAPPALHLYRPGDGMRRWCPEPPDPALLPQLVVRHVTYPSLDGTEVGLFVVHRADLEPSASTPLILTGYGGFAITESPAWMPNLAAWCAAGGAYAIAGLRGGFEHGEAWHQAGRRGNKQHVFDDFHAAADWLVANGFTSRERLGIAGGSNGGLLMGAAITQRPDLARAVWCAVPLLDMIRFPQFLIARLWTDEYGDPDVAEEFAWLYAYSPYHHVIEGVEYPPVLFTTAEGDTRVDPLHARKMAALLVDASGSQADRPILLHQAGRAGHGVGKPASMRVDEGADVLAFFAWQLGVEHLVT